MPTLSALKVNTFVTVGLNMILVYIIWQLK